MRTLRRIAEVGVLVLLAASLSVGAAVLAALCPVLIPAMACRSRWVEVPAAGLLIAVLGLPMLLIAALVRLESPGPAIFRQRRIGLCGKCFTMLKFRTMRPDADPYGMSPHSGEDPRLTRRGRRLRETSLDELPQLLNVIVGDMSLLGPRPLYRRQAALWTARQRRRLEVRPGIAGYAQAFGRGELPIEDKIELDLYYVDHRSWRLDLRILLETLRGALGGRAVYEQQYSRSTEFERPGQKENGGSP